MPNTAPTYNAIIADTGESVSTNVASNTTKSGAISAAGDYVIVTTASDANGNGVFYQRYTVGGAPVGNPVQVNTFTTDDQLYPSISALANGGWAITWTSVGQDGAASYGVFQKAYDILGNTAGSDIQVNSFQMALGMFTSRPIMPMAVPVVEKCWSIPRQRDINCFLSSPRIPITAGPSTG